MIATVSKSWQFQAAHRNPFHPGECSRTHGHTYTIRVWARGPVKDDGSAEHSMVVDFRRLSDAVKRHVLDRFDHTLLNDVADDPVFEAYTVEELAIYALRTISEDVPEVVRVRVYEGANAYAEVEK